ncbi:putative heme-binding protein [Candidatus Sulfopaludibacter sp. SbA6]|nr:putative heme-binding protein [Candidatus Sulfopaludibacter sp. SbA6]
MHRWILTVAVLASANAQTPADPAVGRKIFESQCALCHGQTGTGGRGPGLNRPKLNRAPDDEALRKVISEGINPEMPGAWQLSKREVASVAEYVRSLGTVAPEPLAGDAARGAGVYESKGCPGCHIVGGKGQGIGPELSDIGARRNGVYLRKTLLKPTDSLPEDFLYVAAVTSSGETVRGIRVNEDSFTIQLKDARGRFHSFRKAELKELRRLKQESPMPSYERSLSAAELDDIVAYLASLRGKS